MKPFSIIVAFDSQYGIGKNGRLAWSLPEDMKHFKEITTAVTRPGTSNAVVMGRNTWESLPEKFRPLPGRINAVLSTRGHLKLPAGVLLFSGLDEALSRLSVPDIENIFVIGGAQLYDQALDHPFCHKLYVTHVRGEHACDKFFPPVSSKFLLHSSSEEHRAGDISFQFCEYLRG